MTIKTKRQIKIGSENMEINRQKLDELRKTLENASVELEKLQAKKKELLKRYEMSVGLDQSELIKEIKKNENDFLALNKQTKLIVAQLKVLVDNQQ